MPPQPQDPHMDFDMHSFTQSQPNYSIRLTLRANSGREVSCLLGAAEEDPLFISDEDSHTVSAQFELIGATGLLETVVIDGDDWRHIDSCCDVDSLLVSVRGETTLHAALQAMLQPERCSESN